MKEKTCVITGATAGIGFETALALANMGAEVIILGRNPEKGKRIQRIIREDTENEQVHFLEVDLALQGSIRTVAQEILHRWDRIDVLIHNAGTWFSERILTEEMVEMVWAVHHIAPFLLTHLLLPAMFKADDARIINVNSDAHKNGHIDFEDLEFSKNYHGLRSYARSKLANCLFTYELDRKLRERNIHNITVNAVQPGLVKTDIGLKHTFLLHQLAWKIRRLGGVSPEEGAKTSVFLASSPKIKGESGKYWDKCKPKPSAKQSYRVADAKRLWEVTQEMCDVPSFFPETPEKTQ